MESEKEQLYKSVVQVKRYLGYGPYQHGINIVENWAFGIKLERLPFKTRGLRGMAYVSEKPYPDIILLNTKRSMIEQNYDCGHELMHLSKHRNLKQKSFNCFDMNTAPHQDPFLEWQANEGAAEFFVPYRFFIPFLKDYFNNAPRNCDVQEFKQYAADIFKVPPAVIKYRLESLKYEILQYYAGSDIDDIQIISKRQQERMGIYVKSLNDIRCNERFDIYNYIAKKPLWHQPERLLNNHTGTDPIHIS